MSRRGGLVRANTLPPGLTFIYHAEGAANIVYKIELEEKPSNEILHSETESHGFSSPLPTELENWEVQIPYSNLVAKDLWGKLLRLRKDRADTVSPKESQQDFERLIKPLFGPDELVHSVVVQINEQLVLQLNADLKILERLGTRPPFRHGVYLRLETCGTIVDDIGYGLEPNGKMFELKPKWLSQSPDAPKNARRCRTCALRAMRAANKSPEASQATSRNLKPSNNSNRSEQQAQACKPELPQRNGFCPLDLASQNKSRVSKAINHYIGNDQAFTREEINHISTYLTTSILIQKLKHSQDALSAPGAFQVDPPTTNSRLLMTLRDCSLFITISSSTGVTNARLGDLDLKSALRAPHWQSLERELLTGGWYEITLDDNGQGRCALEQ